MQQCKCLWQYSISIHAPAKGATLHQNAGYENSRISIHAPAKGATTDKRLSLSIYRISIHAPAKGATDNVNSAKHAINISIHAPAKGATMLTTPTLQNGRFQSTLPRRERRRSSGVKLQYLHFNPRSREGSDYSRNAGEIYDSEFQSTLPRRERRCSRRRRIPTQQFQSTLPRRERQICTRLPLSGFIFQSTLPRRERRHLLTSFRLQYGYFYFISPIKYSSCFKKIN